MLSPEQIFVRLDQRFRLLTGGDRTALPRQRTLQALFDWSYDLLSTRERILFQRLSVFSGGWTLEAAEFVTGIASIESYEALDLLEELVNKSLVVTDDSGLGMRYQLLETVRQYALVKLEENDEAEKIRDGHLVYFVEQTVEGMRAMGALRGMSWLDSLAPESDNFRAARARALDRDLQAAFRLVAGVTTRWSQIMPAAEILRFIHSVLAKAESDPEFTGEDSLPQNRRLVAAALATGSTASLGLGLAEQSLEYALRSAAIAREEGDSETLVWAGSMAALANAQLGDLESAQVWAEESKSLAGQIDNRWIAAMTLVSWGGVLTAPTSSDREKAWSRWEEGMSMFRQGNELWGLGMGNQVAAFSLMIEGRPGEAQVFAEQSLAYYTEIGDRHFANIPRSILAEIARQRGDLERASSMYRQVLRVWRDVGNYGALARCLECLGFIARARAEIAEKDEQIAHLERAALLLGSAEAIRTNYLSSMAAEERPEYEAEVAAIRDTAGENAFQAAWQRGHLVDLDQAVAFALDKKVSTPF
jgi:predicted ATPase